MAHPLDIEGHTSRAFDGAMSSLHLAVVEVGGLVLMQARQAGASYVDRDPALARQVADRHNLVSIRVRAIEETVLALIARRQPVASDLRVILAMSRTAWEYARASGTAARVAAGVSGQGGRAAEGPGQATGRDVRHLAELAQDMLSRGLEALDRLDPALAGRVVLLDAELDAEFAAGLRRLMSRTIEDGRLISRGLESAFALKSFERIGDHAKAVAQLVCDAGQALAQARDVPAG